MQISLEKDAVQCSADGISIFPPFFNSLKMYYKQEF